MTKKLKPVGRPSKYEDWMPDLLKKVASEGGHIPAMCVALGISSEDTFHRWKKEYPEFNEAYNEAKVISQAFYEALLLKGATGQIDKFNASAFALLMNNKFSHEYKLHRQESSNVTINNVNLSNDQLDYKIAQKLELLRRTGQEFVGKLIENDDEHTE